MVEDKVTLRLDISECIFDFLCMVEEEEYEQCAELRDDLYEVYDVLDDDNKNTFRRFVKDFMEEEELTEDVALKGLFRDILK